MEKTRQKLVKFFGENGFKITTIVNVKVVEFLDVKLDLSTRQFKPFRKSNDGIPRYVHKQSNHPPTVIKRLPEMINNKYSNNSCNEEVFNEVKPTYQTGLKNSGYNFEMKYNPRSKKEKKPRKRRTVWFNPPWSNNIKTPIGNYFLEAVDQCFPKESPLHKIYNRKSLKISYRTVRNLKSYISLTIAKSLTPLSRRNPHATAVTKVTAPYQASVTVKM